MKITLELTDDAYELLKCALEDNNLNDQHNVRSWLEEEFNNNTEVLIEALLDIY
jgi:hypothetical protein